MTFHPFPPTPNVFEYVIDHAASISLERMNERAGLMTRLDQKYFVPRDVLGEILEGYRGLRVLEINGTRAHRYASTYLDTPEFKFFRQHTQGRRHRNKVRFRTYSTGEAFLEVKSKGTRGVTVKERIPVPPSRAGGRGLDGPARAFIDEQIPGHPGLSENLVPVLDTHYDRVTVLQGGNRLTCDLNLRFVAEGGAEVRGPDDVLVETKSATGRSPIDHAFRSVGIRPVSVSKYGVGMSLHYPLPSNTWHRVLTRHFGAAEGLDRSLSPGAGAREPERPQLVEQEGHGGDRPDRDELGPIHSGEHERGVVEHRNG